MANMSDEVNSIIEEIKNETDFFKKAKLILFLKKEKQIPLGQISKRVNLKPSYISHILRLNRLPELILDGYYADLISVSHLFIISRLRNEKDMIALYERILGHDMTTLQTDEEVRAMLYKVRDEGFHIPRQEIDDFIEFMRNQFQIDVKVIQTRIKGKIILEVKGNLSKSSSALRKIINVIKSHFVSSQAEDS